MSEEKPVLAQEVWTLKQQRLSALDHVGPQLEFLLMSQAVRKHVWVYVACATMPPGLRQEMCTKGCQTETGPSDPCLKESDGI